MHDANALHTSECTEFTTVCNLKIPHMCVRLRFELGPILQNFTNLRLKIGSNNGEKHLFYIFSPNLLSQFSKMLGQFCNIHYRALEGILNQGSVPLSLITQRRSKYSRQIPLTLPLPPKSPLFNLPSLPFPNRWLQTVYRLSLWKRKETFDYVAER